MRYVVLPFVGKVKGAQTAVDVSKQLEAILNQGAREGFRFEQVNSVSIQVQPGCLAALFGAKVAYVQYDMVVFSSGT